MFFASPVHSCKTQILRPIAIVREVNMAGKEEEELGRRKKAKKHFFVTGI